MISLKTHNTPNFIDTKRIHRDFDPNFPECNMTMTNITAEGTAHAVLFLITSSLDSVIKNKLTPYLVDHLDGQLGSAIDLNNREQTLSILTALNQTLHGFSNTHKNTILARIEHVDSPVNTLIKTELGILNYELHYSHSLRIGKHNFFSKKASL